MGAIIGVIIIAILAWVFFSKVDGNKKVSGTCSRCGKSDGLYETWKTVSYDGVSGSVLDSSGCRYCEQMDKDFAVEENQKINAINAICTNCGKANDTWNEKTTILNEEKKNNHEYVFVEYAEVCTHCSHKRNITTRWEPK